MLAQKVIREWAAVATAIFCKFMPLRTFPEVCIGGRKTFFQKRADLVLRLHCNAPSPDERGYDSVMELVHGDCRDAILIRQECLVDVKKNPRAQEYFFNCF